MGKKIDANHLDSLFISGCKYLKLNNFLSKRLSFHIINTKEMRKIFDKTCDKIHYAGSCQRVGKCVRLAVIKNNEWIGGVVLGSTFPNIKPRDDVFKLTQYVKNWKAQGLISPWAKENKKYWNGLQLIVNHARTFIFPQFQGNGLGIAIHKLLLTEGRQLWESKYNEKIYGFDTLDTHPKSRLFLENGWKLVGRTKGYSRDPNRVFSKRAFNEKWEYIKDNSGLNKTKNSTRWWIYVKVFKKFSSS